MVFLPDIRMVLSFACTCRLSLLTPGSSGARYARARMSLEIADRANLLDDGSIVFQSGGRACDRPARCNWWHTSVAAVGTRRAFSCQRMLHASIPQRRRRCVING
jgi:hypothetical protein